MRNHSFFWLVFLISFCSTSFGQSHKSAPNDSLDKKTIKKILNEQFSGLITGQSKTSIGNFASLDLKESEVSFAGDRITKQGNILVLKAAGGILDGLFSILYN